jgi:V-type H+-transporting ATPase subunit e
MGFGVITLYYLLAALLGSLGIRIWYNKGPASNQMHVVLVNTAVICCYLMWAIVYLAQLKPLVVPILKGEGE